MSDADTVSTPDFDVIVAGAGMAGMYQLYLLRELGFSVRVFETADDVGGTWYWNRYPGARCDIQTVDYSYTWDPELEAEWKWSESYATQPEILRYLQHVADKHDLRRDIQFSTRVDSAVWDDDAVVGRSRTERRRRRHVPPLRDGHRLPVAAEDPRHRRAPNGSRGDVYFTSRWPHEGVDFTGKRVAVIGTGSSGIQSIPIIASQASQLTVFQRTPNFSIPARNGPLPEERRKHFDADPRRLPPRRAKWSRAGVPMGEPTGDQRARRVGRGTSGGATSRCGRRASSSHRRRRYTDILTNAEANETVGEFVRDKIRSIVDGSGDRRDAVSEVPLHRHEAPVPRHGLLRDVQPAPRPPRRSPQARRSRTITETGIDTSAETLRVRRHRLRHRLRRDDRRHRRRSTSPAATASRSPRSGPTGPRPISA